MKEGLLLIHPAITTLPEVLEQFEINALKQNIKIIHRLLIDKLANDASGISDNKYEVIIYLTPEKEDDVKFPVTFIPIIFGMLNDNGYFYGLSDKYKLPALVNGFEIDKENNKSSTTLAYRWRKKTNYETNQTVGLVNRTISNINRNSKKYSKTKLPSFKKKLISVGKNVDIDNISQNMTAVLSTPLIDDNIFDDNNEELEGDSDKLKYFESATTADFDDIEEDSLLEKNIYGMGSDSITMLICGKTKTKTKKACKDCSCGLKEDEQKEINKIRNTQKRAIKFSKEELTEVDFTIESKRVGGCGSCTLGDAFRCSGCPYLGLPAFKPGQAINLTSIVDDL
ncbi:hypothetical protein TPHA_0J01300 [Tetrapisispora phaffii CBS 4417]|uniref:Uncharacterized protein n=1 Tax=Tetrapisispora phaffii (strain ATCC 24235 / CBS 4417 / NBRC 1672 / NRRL Y-8282 / UCD 70-5) TaxID=1071381 RepID=G8BYL0_TETPH|nr:hypothetical protein TPHA_0J01300 [Tetrapisispora phaffii CBS 4417]CCE64952.1 hypothetical protein TPHA_0J01300 [Tetrapisispora phaffii CBS 4417]